MNVTHTKVIHPSIHMLHTCKVLRAWTAPDSEYLPYLVLSQLSSIPIGPKNRFKGGCKVKDRQTSWQSGSENWDLKLHTFFGYKHIISNLLLILNQSTLFLWLIRYPSFIVEQLFLMGGLMTCGFLKLGSPQVTIVVSIPTWSNNLDDLGVPPWLRKPL